MNTPSNGAVIGIMMQTPECLHSIWTILRGIRTTTLAFGAPGIL